MAQYVFLPFAVPTVVGQKPTRCVSLMLHDTALRPLSGPFSQCTFRDNRSTSAVRALINSFIFTSSIQHEM